MVMFTLGARGVHLYICAVVVSDRGHYKIVSLYLIHLGPDPKHEVGVSRFEDGFVRKPPEPPILR